MNNVELIESSPAFVRMPECNGCAERFIRTLKENLLWVRHFKTIVELRLALLGFSQIYNENWIMYRDKYKIPAQFRRDIIEISRNGSINTNTCLISLGHYKH